MDASCIIAVIRGEPGAQAIFEKLSAADCAISTVNLSEVAAKMADLGTIPEQVRSGLDAFSFDVHAFDEEQAIAAGLLRPTTRAAGLSFGDRACLSLAMALGTPVLTADRAWATLALPIEVILAR